MESSSQNEEYQIIEKESKEHQNQILQLTIEKLQSIELLENSSKIDWNERINICRDIARIEQSICQLKSKSWSGEQT